MRGVRGETERLWKLWKDLSARTLAGELGGLSYLTPKVMLALNRLAFVNRPVRAATGRTRTARRKGFRVVR